jgi:hypothetical protein
MGAGTHVACNVQRLFYCFTGELGVVASKGVIVGGSGGVRPRQFSSLEWEQGKGPRSPGRRRRALKRWPLVVGPGRRRFPFSPFSKLGAGVTVVSAVDRFQDPRTPCLPCPARPIAATTNMCV